MNKSESKYFNTAKRMDDALCALLSEKDLDYVTVKEICARAQVNRSTFYLHYETIDDLLMEILHAVNEKFRESYAQKPFQADKTKKDYFFTTDEWLIPYLTFIRENKHIYKAVHNNAAVFGVEAAFDDMFRNIFSPILSKYGAEREKHEYVMAFYRSGLGAVIMKWVGHDCSEPVEYISGILKGFFADQGSIAQDI